MLYLQNNILKFSSSFSVYNSLFFCVRVVLFIIFFYYGSTPADMAGLEIPDQGIGEVSSEEGHFSKHRNKYIALGAILVASVLFFYFYKGGGETPNLSSAPAGLESTRGGGGETPNLSSAPAGLESTRGGGVEESKGHTSAEEFRGRHWDGLSEEYSLGHYPSTEDLGHTLHAMEPAIDSVLELVSPSALVVPEGLSEPLVEACRSIIDGFAGIGVLSAAEAVDMVEPFTLLTYVSLIKPLVLVAVEELAAARFIIASCMLEPLPWMITSSDTEVSQIWKTVLADCLLHPDLVTFNGFTKPVWGLYSILKHRCAIFSVDGLHVNSELKDKRHYILSEVLGDQSVQKLIEDWGQ